jgi:O-antigen ligase
VRLEVGGKRDYNAPSLERPEDEPMSIAENRIPFGGQVSAIPKERLPLISILVALFIIGAVAVTTQVGWNYIVKGAGFVLGVAFLISIVRARVRIVPEAFIYFVWVVWCLVGITVAVSSFVFWEMWGTVIQMSALFVIMSCYAVSRRTFQFSMLMFIVGFTILVGYSFITGQYELAESGTRRLGSLVRNPNEFAWVMLLSVVAMAYLWMQPTRLSWLKNLLLVAGLGIAMVSSISSESRMGLVAIAVFFPAWVWFCYRREMVRNPRVMGAVILFAIVGGAVFIYYVVSSSTVMDRIQATIMFWQTGYDPEGSTGSRYHLLMRAWDVILENPLIGVGIDNFIFYTGTGHLMAHCDLAEVGTASGLPGLALYIAVFAILWFRCGKIRKHTKDPHAYKLAGLVRALIVVLFICNFGTVNYYHKATWIVLGCMAGYTSRLWHDLRSQSAAAAHTSHDLVAYSAPAGSGLLGGR